VKEVSDCCEEPVVVRPVFTGVGKVPDWITQWYECTGCEEPCNVIGVEDE